MTSPNTAAKDSQPRGQFRLPDPPEREPDEKMTTAIHLHEPGNSHHLAQTIAIEELADGILQGYSEVMDLHIRWERGHLRWHDPATGRHIATFEDERAPANDERARADNAEARVRELEEKLRRLRGD
jgi:hypothetical protein